MRASRDPRRDRLASWRHPGKRLYILLLARLLPLLFVVGISAL